MTKDNITFLPDVSLHLPPIPNNIIDITYENHIDKEFFFIDFIENIPNTTILPFASSSLIELPIKNARYLTLDNDVKTVIEVSLDNQDSSLDFKPGDTIGILPQNSEEEVDFIINHLDLEKLADVPLNLKCSETKKKTNLPSHLPVKGSIRYILRSFVDLRSVLKKVFICTLSNYTENSSEKRCLEELSSREGSHLYAKHILENNTSILDIFMKYPSCKPPISQIFQHLPRLMPRPYSICNSAALNKDIIKICFSVAEINGKKQRGIATGWMEKKILFVLNKDFDSCQSKFKEEFTSVDLIRDKLEKLKVCENDNVRCNLKIPAYLRKSNSFCLPEDYTKPIIMIAIGTGLAPFIGFLEERQFLKNNKMCNEFGEIHLYFGCRYFKKDFIYKEELNKYLHNNVLTQLRVSYSREETYPTKYVQDNILQDAEDFVNLIMENEAVVYVCGDINKINKDISFAVLQSLCKVKNVNMSEAENILSELKKTNRYIQDIWS